MTRDLNSDDLDSDYSAKDSKVFWTRSSYAACTTRSAILASFVNSIPNPGTAEILMFDRIRWNPQNNMEDRLVLAVPSDPRLYDPTAGSYYDHNWKLGLHSLVLTISEMVKVFI